ncbi:MAG: thiamine diphosphokinase [Pseudomonadota bacterium]|nr:thiamine diphosphokinase [Pseudomonadota bacterium]
MLLSDQTFSYDSAVVLVGAAPVAVDPLFADLPDSWPIVAADGGAHTVLASGRRPDLVIGDMDSSTDLPADIARLHLTGQDDTDFEKCLKRIAAPLIIGFGFLDARLDHTLAALHALMAVPHDAPIMLIGASDMLLRVRGDVTFRANAGERVSIWPLGNQRFLRSCGLRWPLDGLEMGAGHLVGTSNAAKGGDVEIIADAGDGYAVILPVAAAPSLLPAVMPAIIAGD